MLSPRSAAIPTPALIETALSDVASAITTGGSVSTRSRKPRVTSAFTPANAIPAPTTKMKMCPTLAGLAVFASTASDAVLVIE